MRKTIIFLMLLAMLLLPGITAADTTFAYCQTISYNATDVSEYQQDLVVHRTTGTAYEETSGGLKIWHLYVGDHCQEDYGDVRFTNMTGAEQAYYLWDDYDSSSARFCVRLEGADADGTLTVHYGNPSATTTSDGNATYLLYDDFSGASLDTFLSKWSAQSATITSVSDGVLEAYPSAAYGGIRSVDPLPPTPILIQASVANRNGDNNQNSVGLSATTGATTWYNTNSGLIRFTSDNNVWQSWTRTTQLNIAYGLDEAYHSYTIRHVPGSAPRYTVDSTSVQPSTTLPSGTYYLWILKAYTPYGSVRWTKIDWVLVRAYSAAPPSATSFSGERESFILSAFTATPTSGTAPLTVQFTDTSLGDVTAWSWSFGDGDASASQNPSHTYTSTGTYTVSLTVANDVGEDTETKNEYITVADAPAFSVSASPRSGAAPLTVAFSALQISTTPITSWAWTFGDGNTSTEHNPVHNYTETGTYTVTVTGSHAYGSTQVVRTAYIQVRTDVIIQPNINETRIQSAVNNYDPMNGKYTRYWSNMSGGFPVYGFVFSIVAPFVEFFGYWFFVILWFVYLGCAYLRTGSTTIPLVVGLISGSVWGAVMPPESHLIAYVLLAIAAVGLLMKIYVRDRL